MKKNFLRKFAFVLVFILFITGLTPATLSEAASVQSLNATSKTLNVGKTFDFNVKGKVSKSKYVWTSSNTTVAKVNKSNGLVTAMAPGKATITCKITLPTKKTVSLKATVTVKLPATGVTVNNSVDTVKVGVDVYDFNRTLTPAKSTDKTYWEIDNASNTAGATMKLDGTVTTTQAGEFKFRAVTAANRTNYEAGKTTATSSWYTVKVPFVMESVKQISKNEIQLTFNSNVKELLSLSDFNITYTTINQENISDIKYSDNGKVVTLTISSTFIYGLDYTITCKEYSKTFTGSIAAEIDNTTSPSTPDPEPIVTPDPVIMTSLEYSAAMAPGWNLGNSFDSFDTGGDKGEISWGNPVVTKDVIRAVKDAGYNSIRMPFTAYMRTGDAPDYKIDETFLARYAEVVQWAIDEDLYVMVNVHHDSWTWVQNIGADDGSAMDKYKAIWTQLADYFKNYSGKVCFESINEPYFDPTEELDGEYKTTAENLATEACVADDNWADYWNRYSAKYEELKELYQLEILDEVNTEFVNLVRASGGINDSRMLILPTLTTNDSATRCNSLLNTMNTLGDDHLIATFHYYGYWPFSANIAGVTSMEQDTDEDGIKEKIVEDYIADAFYRVHDTFINNGYGVVCGEYGLVGFDNDLGTVEPGEVLKYMECVNSYANDTDITLMLWDNGQHLNRNTCTWYNERLFNVLKASFTGRSSYAISDRLFISDTMLATNEDYTMDLYLNGNTLVTVKDTAGTLIADTNYTVSGSAIIFKADYLKSLTADIDTYGECNTITLEFNSGSDWNIDVIYYAAPEVVGVTRNDDGSMDIQVRYNGDYLETIETYYSNSLVPYEKCWYPFPGPNDWTAFKQHTEVYLSNRDGNTVTINSNFFENPNTDEMDKFDNTYRFTLHFWSSSDVTFLVKLNADGSVNIVNP
ncbi:cellulase family glycosylhydrolase [Anaerosporobacter sp.]|uniref:cellulase family glycosylhydrolase n=1 Tax=Anaerosporobacter sp. TaxID=1872529 RepID=UPI00286EC33B|nr:cellulase family glycosylhydrolase [Anaerosporobacter sp.]